MRRLTEIVNGGNFETPALSPLKLEVKPFDYDVFLQYAKGLENQREGGLRCAACFEMRLDATAKYAKEQGFDLFGTTLTVSPYKNSALLTKRANGRRRNTARTFCIPTSKSAAATTRAYASAKVRAVQTALLRLLLFPCTTASTAR